MSERQKELVLEVKEFEKIPESFVKKDYMENLFRATEQSQSEESEGNWDPLEKRIEKP